MRHLDPTDPRRIGPYTLLGRLGAGGMGTVYLGRSAGGRTVAVKVIRPELADDERFRARFRGEVAAARTVSGAFTAPVVDADPDGPQPWMATAFVPGLSLHRAVDAHGPLPEAALGTLAAGIAEALVGIHAAGLVHRDLKPANVLLAADGPHVIDFGISRAADGTALTATGVVVGSPGFLAPEQALDEAVTPATDVFALGATLVYAAGGRGAFGEGPAHALLFRVVNSAPDLSAVPAALREVVAGCLEKRPEQRPTPRQVIAAIEQTAPAATSGSWLPAPLMADVLAAAQLVTGAPTPPAPPAPTPTPQAAPAPTPPAAPTPPTGTTPAGTAPTADDGSDRTVLLGRATDSTGPGPTGPSRRRLLLGLAGGAVAVAGGAVAAVLEP
ncbi:serine/threonine-protein kinase, partial [Kitasatospora sp. NPDC058965]|uniref:serine/threonine-protein kinase n=1 Tax=Kitasatospora sp. NPDC058965 TaxID=3346682 RepID=UPI0036C3B297